MRPIPCLFALAAMALSFTSGAADSTPDVRLIRIETEHVGLSLFRGEDGRLYQVALGARSSNVPVPEKWERKREFHPQWGDGYFAEPALQVTHADGNTSTDLVYVRHETKPVGDGVTLTRIELKDPEYPLHVALCFKAYSAFDVIEQWTELCHEEPAAVELERFASSSPIFGGSNLFLTQYVGDWANEMNPSTELLTPGIKIIDSKIGVRAHQFRNPSFLLSRGGPAQENAGEVWAGALAWPGSFQFAFDTNRGSTRALCGMNPFASRHRLEPGCVFTTPAMTWAWSKNGVGPLSRNLHRWARTCVLRDGNHPRAVLLNNWEATFFKFNEQKLVSLFDGAKAVGCDLFLLDDGWFGVKHPRNNDDAGLGDWQVNPAKLPGGVGYLCEKAKERGLRFGIWLEPEMVNPKSELFERHPDWAIRQPHRELEPQRNQLVLDLSRPEVKQYVLECVDGLLTANPGVSYVKWDCNRYLTQPGSPWLKPGFQSHLGIDYNNAVLEIMRAIAERHPKVELMVCSGGGGRVDFGSMRFFHEFWPSDNTDPVRRVTMQWDYSTLFPAIAIAGHVTHMGKRPLKFAFDVAMSARLGMDMDLSKLTPEELAFAGTAIATYKQHFLPVVQFGDLYRLENPHAGPRSALNYVSADKSRAVIFVLQTADGNAAPVKPAGIDPGKRYRVAELNLLKGAPSRLPQQGKTLDGAVLMRDGITPACSKACDSFVAELVAEP